ncbi:hypothetical protein Z043_123127, partial [Scleropages formosus]
AGLRAALSIRDSTQGHSSSRAGLEPATFESQFAGYVRPTASLCGTLEEMGYPVTMLRVCTSPHLAAIGSMVLCPQGPGEEENDDDDEDDYDDDDDGNEGSSKPPASYRPHLRFAYTHSIADRLRRPRAPLGQAFGQLSTTETPRPMDSQEQDKGKDSPRVSTWRRAEPGGPGPVDGDAVVTRGRVAQLTKTFSVVGSSGAEPRAKPPVPVKPIHLRTSSSVKRSLR